jgi:cytochrome c oxidase subunit 2
VAQVKDAQPARGQLLTQQYGCIGCHNLDPDVQMTGPTWNNIGALAGARVKGQSAVDYLYTSIVAPNAYIVEGYPANIMAQTYGQMLAQQDIVDIIGYLLSQKTEQ